MNRRGVTLPETLIALVLLAACILLVARLFQRSSREQIRTMNIQRSASMAESVLDRIRDWASDPANFFSDWSAWDGTTIAEDGLEAQVDVRKDRPLFSSCAAREGQEAEQRTLTNSTVWVRVRAEGVELVTAVAAPPRTLGSVTLTTTVPQPIPHGAEAEFTASATDSDGRPIPDLFYDWRVVPVTDGAWAEVSQGRVARTARLKHTAYTEPDWVPGGKVKLEVEFRYHGQRLRRQSAEITLE